MSQRVRWRWLPRFSLKSFLLVCLLGGGGVAWVSQVCSEYLVEQRVIETLSQRMPPGSLMMVNTNGTNVARTGNIFM